MVYVKPISGTHGKGVIRVEYLPEKSSCRYQINNTIKSCSTFNDLHQALLAYTHKKKYIVQKGIYLLKHHKRRFDIRVMVQKNLRNKWETTGIIGRLSHPERIVTNYHNGGTMISFEKLLSEHLSPATIAGYKSDLRRLGAEIGRQLSTAYPRLKELGIDVAIDKKLHPWVLEVNTKPHPYVFRMLKDKSVYQKIRRYSLAYGGMKGKSK